MGPHIWLLHAGPYVWLGLQGCTSGVARGAVHLVWHVGQYIWFGTRSSTSGSLCKAVCLAFACRAVHLALDAGRYILHCMQGWALSTSKETAIFFDGSCSRHGWYRLISGKGREGVRLARGVQAGGREEGQGRGGPAGGGCYQRTGERLQSGRESGPSSHPT